MNAVMRPARALVLLALFALTLSGCAAEPDAPAASGAGEAGAVTGAAPEIPAATESDSAPAADPALSLEDESGRTPADAFEEHMVAVATGDPEAVWNTYGCSPPAEFETWALEWEDAAEVYSGARVLEERVISPELALVRVTYRVTSGDDEVIIEEPGEWWRIELVEGAWKVGWLPRQ